ncbi:GspE/PulE family protein [Alphaproteobacteria bacterium LSUCC0684]
MTIYKDDVAEKVIRVLKTANRLDLEKLKMVQDELSAPSDVLEALLQDGNIDEDLVQTVLSRAYAIRRLKLNPGSRAVSLLPKDVIETNKALPYAVEGRFLKVAIVDPTTSSQAGNFKSLSNYNIEFQLIPLSTFENLRAHEKLRLVLDPKKSDEAQPRLHAGPSRSRRGRYQPENEERIPKFCDDILLTAINCNASDIHIEIFRETARLRFRIDGRLVVRNEFSDFLTRHYLSVITRLKIQADCDISEKRLPQDGAITIRHESEDIDFRFNVLPGKNGERIVMRILKGDPALKLDSIGLSETSFKKVLEAISAPQGMVLVTGPTGSGKTTTLYGALQWINNPALNIMTAEDPVEYYLEGIGQVQANEKIGLTFSNILRAFLRQDPEVILVGEIRDQETVDIAIKAALTGHLLLSTLHTNDAISTISRLMNMGVPPFMVSAAVSLIVAQRLARANCSNCLVEDNAASPESLIRLGFSEDQAGNVIPHRGAGCDVCNHTGYKGRRGIYEVLKINSELEGAILNGANPQEILSAARVDGFKTMQEIARDMIREKLISVEEYTRVLVLG